MGAACCVWNEAVTLSLASLASHACTWYLVPAVMVGDSQRPCHPAEVDDCGSGCACILVSAAPVALWVRGPVLQFCGLRTAVRIVDVDRSRSRRFAVFMDVSHSDRVDDGRQHSGRQCRRECCCCLVAGVASQPRRRPHKCQRKQCSVFR